MGGRVSDGEGCGFIVGGGVAGSLAGSVGAGYRAADGCSRCRGVGEEGGALGAAAGADDVAVLGANPISRFSSGAANGVSDVSEAGSADGALV